MTPRDAETDRTRNPDCIDIQHAAELITYRNFVSVTMITSPAAVGHPFLVRFCPKSSRLIPGRTSPTGARCGRAHYTATTTTTNTSTAHRFVLESLEIGVKSPVQPYSKQGINSAKVATYRQNHAPLKVGIFFLAFFTAIGAVRLIDDFLVAGIGGTRLKTKKNLLMTLSACTF